MKLSSRRIELPDSIEAIENELYQKGCTDGLPIVPPTEERVAAMLSRNNYEPERVVAVIPPRRAEATMEKIAINAVMAGCRPEYLPVIVAALEAMTGEGFDLYGIQATTHPCGMLTIVNGPIADKIGLNAGYGVFGPGWKANATIGRAIRLILLNIGGGTPGKVDKATLGDPGKYTYCIAENEKANPWEPLHVGRGFPISESTVTVIAAEGPHDISDHESTRADSLLRTVASTMASPGCSNAVFTGGDIVLCLCPEHASTIARDGYSKDDVKEYLFKNARIPQVMFSPEAIAVRKKAPHQHGYHGDDPVQIADAPGNIIVIVAGGAGKHSAYIPSFGFKHRAVTKPIKL